MPANCWASVDLPDPDEPATRTRRTDLEPTDARLWAESAEGGTVTRVVVDVVMKPEILDPQGQAILGALGRLGIEGVNSVRQGKHFELDIEDSLDNETLTKLADTLLANPVIEDFTIRR
jgi:phosphoribosylformylglycinamidine synthase PurS subunit